MEHIALKIKKLRTEKGLTQSELARLCRVPPVTIWNIEMGKRGAGLKSVVRIAKVLGVSIDWLVREDVYIFDKETREIAFKFQKLPPENRKKVKAYLNRFSPKS